MKEAIKKAIEAGWKIPEYRQRDMLNLGRMQWNAYSSHSVTKEECFFDPLFWQALGRSLNLSQEEVDVEIYESEMIPHLKVIPWIVLWHGLIGHLAEGKNADEFFNDLLK